MPYCLFWSRNTLQSQFFFFRDRHRTAREQTDTGTGTHSDTEQIKNKDIQTSDTHSQTIARPATTDYRQKTQEDTEGFKFWLSVGQITPRKSMVVHSLISALGRRGRRMSMGLGSAWST